MNIFYSLNRPATAVLIALAAAQAAHAVADPRSVVCAQACTLQLKAAKGFIDIKVPSASGTLRTLYNPGDRFDLEAGKEYVLFLNESMEGWFSFDLLFTPQGRQRRLVLPGEGQPRGPVPAGGPDLLPPETQHLIGHCDCAEARLRSPHAAAALFFDDVNAVVFPGLRVVIHVRPDGPRCLIVDVQHFHQVRLALV